MIIKMMITFDFNPETNEYTPIKQEVVKDKATKTITKAGEAEESAEPQLTLEDNKYILNQSAATLMGVQWEDRLSIKYQKIEGLTFPVIGTDAAFGTKGGNKLTKSLSVSCRGKANELLAKYGDTFTVTKMKGHDDLFVLLGNADRPTEPEKQIDTNINIKEDNNPVEDLPLDTTIEDENAYEISDDSLNFEI